MWVGRCFQRRRDEGGCGIPHGDGGEDEDGLVDKEGGEMVKGFEGRNVGRTWTVLTYKARMVRS